MAGKVAHQSPLSDIINEATKTSSIASAPPASNIHSPADLPTPTPHLPLRKASAHQLQSRARSTPTPLLLPTSHFDKVRGFKPSPVQPVPHVDNFNASSEHAFAGRELRRHSKLPLQELENRGVTLQAARYSPAEDRKRPPSSPLAPTPHDSPFDLMQHGKERELKTSKSVGSSLRGMTKRASRVASHETTSLARAPEELTSARPSLITPDHARDSFRSIATRTSSLAPSGFATERSSWTGNSSTSEFVKIQPEDWEDMDMSVEDAIGMYEEGFESGEESYDGVPAALRPARHSLDAISLNTAERPNSQPPMDDAKPKRPPAAHRRSQSASLLLDFTNKRRQSTAPTPIATDLNLVSAKTPSENNTPMTPKKAQPVSNGPVPRDRYGFKKASQYVTVEQYDAWDATYHLHLERRAAKWHAMMRAYGYMTAGAPIRFPPKNDKIKRYVRKGIPLEFRGAAWFWYAGGPSKLKKEGGLYRRLVEQAETDDLSDNDREHIERDLNRTFPDNIRFKPDPTSMDDAQAGAGGGGPNGTNNKTASKKKDRQSQAEPETPIIAALRRVLQAFAIHNPNIGYCQSLNFIAGLLLLFLDEDEEKTFILLNIVTSTHLPGTHGVALEGANVDIAVLMSCIKDSLPAVWAKLDDKPTFSALMQPSSSTTTSAAGSVSALRLPTVSLATTAWFMSLFVGTLPIECVLRIWDCLFFEGSKTLFRVALAIFKFGEPAICALSDPMEIFQVVQSLPRGLLDINSLMEVCFRRRAGFGGVSQGLIEARRQERRAVVKSEVGVEIDENGVVKKLRDRWKPGTVRV